MACHRATPNPSYPFVTAIFVALISLSGLVFPRPLTAQHQPRCRLGCGGGYAVSVTPDNGTRALAPNSADTVIFTVTNNGTNESSDTYTMACTSYGGVSCVSVNPTSKTLAVGHNVLVTVIYSLGTTSGQVYLTATGHASDQGWYNVGIRGKPSVALRNFNADNEDRALCLTAGAGEAAGWECGDLVVTHGLPGYATMGRERALTLLYNSAQAVPKPIVAVTISEGAVAQPTSVFLRLSINGVPRDSATYTGWGISPYARQAVIAHDATSDSSGIYPFTLLVRNQYASATYDSVITDTLIVVNRSASRFGTGWSLVGVEELRLAQPGNKILWVGGDGSAKVYRNVATNTWVAAAGAFRDTLVYDPGTTTYTRTLRHGIQVKFDAVGHHIQTVNRVGNVTTFTWSANHDTLKSITVPPGVSGTTYTLAYDGAGKLDKITDPAGRILDASVVSNRLTQIIDPDTTAYHTDFAYDASGRLTSRTNRRGFANSYIYAQGLHVDTVKVRLDTAAATYAVTSYRPWDEQGFAVGLTGQAAVDTALGYTKIDGPRPQTDVADTAEFWIDRWGAPTSVRNPLGYVTKLTRGDAAHPALITRVQNALGGVRLATYNARGNVLTTTDSTHQGSGTSAAPAVTTYEYADGNDLDGPSKISSPVDTTRIAYNASVHLPSQVTAQGGHVTTFSYTTSGTYRGVLNSVTENSVKVIDTVTWAKSTPNLTTTFAYDALGNDTSVTAPSGSRTRYVRDAYTRVTSLYDAMSHRTDYGYSKLNWTTRVTTFETYPHADTLLTQYTYNRVGSLLSVVDPRNVNRSHAYDAAERPIKLTDDVGNGESRYFGPSGLLDSTRTRDGHVLKNTWDAAGQLTRTTFPASTPFANTTVPGDTIQRTYDAAGRLLTATNSNGTVTFTYNPEGTVKTERQQVTGALDVTIKYWYDGGNRRIKLFNGTDTLFYTYGTDAQLAKLKVQWLSPGAFPADSFLFFWDGLGRRDSLKYTYGTAVRYGYDADGRLRLFQSVNPTGDNGSLDYLEQRIEYTSMNADGMALTTHRYQGGVLRGGILNATYDARHQLIADNASPSSQTLHYDWSGNILYKQINGVADSFTVAGSSNRLTTKILSGTPDRAYRYDPNGNRIQDSVLGSQYIQMNRYYYNAANQMVGDSETVLNGGGIQWIGQMGNCKYDALGRRVAACGAINTPWRGYDGDNTIIVQNSSGSWKWRMVHGPGLDDPLVAAYTLGGTSKRYYYLTDGRGEQLAFTDSAGYDFSNPSQSLDYTQNGGNQAGGVERLTRFDNSRAESDQAPGISFYRNRYYDQATGRWLQEDPLGIGGGANLYAYAGNNPVAYTDPFGLCPIPPESCPLGHFMVVGALGGAAAGATAGLAVAAPTAELASPFTVPTMATAGALTGALGGLALDVHNHAPELTAAMSSAGEKIKRAVDKTVGTIGIIWHALTYNGPPRKPDNRDDPPPPAPTSTKTVLPAGRDRQDHQQ